MPPTSRRPDRSQAAGSANRSRMYNLAGHAHSSGSLLPRSTDVHAASTSAATSAAAARGVDATDAPYLTNLESHFGRVTLTAPDNLLRKQAKEKKQKIRQRKAQNAQAAAAALAGALQNPLSSSVGRSAMASSSNSLDSSRRYQTTLEDAPVSTGLLLSAPGQHVGMRRAYSGNQTPTLASTSHLQTPPPATSQTTATRTRRRRQSAAREDASRPASRASGTSRPESALSFNDNDPPQAHTSASHRSQQAQNDDRAPRSRTESAPGSYRRSHNAFATAPDDAQPQPTTTTAQTAVQSSATAPHTSLHRQNVWNDITEADPDDLPPPFPEGAPRPPTPPRPPTHSEAANDAQLIGPQPHVRIPDSPPPPFVSDDEDEPTATTDRNASPSRVSPSPPQDLPANAAAADNAADGSRPSSRASTPSSASSSDDESAELTEERRAWEADLRNGLSFEVRLLREQQRRVARERAAAIRAASQREEESEVEARSEGSEEVGLARETATAATVQDAATSPAPALAPLPAEEPVESRASGEQQASAPQEAATPSAVQHSAPASDTQDEPRQTELVATEEPAAVPSSQHAPTVDVVVTPEEASSAAATEPVTYPAPASSPNTAEIAPEPSAASQSAAGLPNQPDQPVVRKAVANEASSDGRLMLANEPRLGLPPMPDTSAAPPSSSLVRTSGDGTAQPTSAPRRISGHRKTNSDTRPAVTSTRAAGDSQVGGSVRTSLGGLAQRRMEGQAVRRHDSDSHLPLSRRPEDTLYVVSAPRPATLRRSSSAENEATSPLHEADAAIPARPEDVADDASSEHAAVVDEDEDDDGAESDSSIEQWLAEAAAFDALRKREEEAAARMQALQEPPVSDSDESDAEEDAPMPGAFTHRPSPHRRQPSVARKVPDPANLALMDQVLPKAPPPLVLGRSRGGAAYSDSSSESTDTEEALDQYSSSDEDDEQHRALHAASLAGIQRKESDPFVNSHISVHARNTSSAPNLAIMNDAQTTASEQPTPVREAGPTRKHGEEAPPLPQRNGEIRPTDARTNTPSRSLSLKAQGKLPERSAAPVATPQLDAPAGDFEEDTSSSRDLSDAEDILPPPHRAASNVPTSTALGSSNPSHRNSVTSLMLPTQSGARRTSLDPLLQPLGYGSYGRTDLGNRLKGLFGQPLVANTAGQPLVANTAGQPSSGLQASTPSALPSMTQPTSNTVEARRSLSDSQRRSNRSATDPETSATMDARRPSESSKPEEQESPEPKVQREDSISVAPSRGSTLRRQPSAGSRSIAAPSVSAGDEPKTWTSSSVPPEQKARDEALAQIAQLSATSQRQESLAALERLLAKTGRPTSMLPPSAVNRAELGGRPQSNTEGPAAEGKPVPDSEQSSAAAAASMPNRLSRQGAIVRANRALPSPPSTLSRAPSSAARPVSFVNPRSSAAPLPRGRLPAITDATRHFPPSASSGPGVAPSWLSYIPSEEKERLPAPLEPQRLQPRATGSRVSAMISRFEAPQEQQEVRSPSSPTKQGASFGGVTRSESNRSNASGEEAANGDDRSEPAVFRRFSRNEGGDEPNEGRMTQRRPPPPPPVLPRRPETNPFRRSEMSDRPTSNGATVTPSASMEALARQIEEAASEWTTASLHGTSDPTEATFGSRLAVPTPSSVSTAAPGGALPRSPRTQAMDTLTRREHEPGAFTPPNLPPKSPLMTPEQILAGSSRNGLSASIAAAQAAAFARRDAREGRSHSASSSVDATNGAPARYDWRGGEAETSRARPLPTLPDSVARRNEGLGISGEEDARGESVAMPVRRSLPVPPPLPTRPRDRNWGSVASSTETRRTTAEASSSSSPQTPHNVPLQRSDPTSRPSIPAPSSVLSSEAGPSHTSAASPASTTVISDSSRASPTSTPQPSDAPRPSPPQPRRDPSLGLTDFDLLVAQLEASGSHFEQLSAIGEFLGPAKPTAATATQLASLSVGVIECDSRRVTREGKIKQKLSCVGVRVDKCAICLAQFKEAQRAVILPCSHIFHEDCTVKLFRRVDRCPTCRAPAF